MIELMKLNGEKFYLNPNLVESMEEGPDTMITMTNDKRYIVRETASEVSEKMCDYYGRVCSYRREKD